MAEEISSSGGSSYAIPLLLVLVAAIALILRFVKKSDKVTTLTSTGDSSASKSSTSKSSDPKKITLDPQADAAYLANCLRPDSTPLDILYAIASTPDNIQVTQRGIDAANEVRAKKLEYLAQKEKEAAHQSMEDLVGEDGGWAEDDEDDAAALAAKKAKEEKEKQAAQLARATGKDVNDVTKVKLEGVDEGVLGQEWVQKQLTELGVWPPPGFDGPISKSKFMHNNKVMGPLEHPAVKRNILMTIGRLHAKQLNTHKELAEAGPKGLIDPTYFKATMEYRQRAGALLEASLRMACTLRCFRLACSILDAMVMFKIGLLDVNDETQKTWFKELMLKQYGASGTPGLTIEEKYLGVPTAPEEQKKPQTPEEAKEAAKMAIVKQIAQSKPVTTDDDKMALEMQITRKHAESFTKEKLAMCQKQGIPPQIGMQAYRESWFIIVRARRVDGDGAMCKDDLPYGADHLELMQKDGNPLFCKMLKEEAINAFKKEFAGGDKDRCEKKIIIGWPFVISNVAQKSGKVKVQLPPPSVPGKYEFTVTIKSQDFLGVDDEFSVVVDVEKGTGKKKKKEEEGSDESNEPKKDK